MLFVLIQRPRFNPNLDLCLILLLYLALKSAASEEGLVSPRACHIFFSDTPVDIKKRYYRYQQTSVLSSLLVVTWFKSWLHWSQWKFYVLLIYQYCPSVLSISTARLSPLHSQMLQVIHVSKCIPELQPGCLTSCKMESCISKQIMLTLAILFLLQKHWFYYINEERHYNFFVKYLLLNSFRGKRDSLSLGLDIRTPKLNSIFI